MLGTVFTVKKLLYCHHLASCQHDQEHFPIFVIIIRRSGPIYAGATFRTVKTLVAHNGPVGATICPAFQSTFTFFYSSIILKAPPIVVWWTQFMSIFDRCSLVNCFTLLLFFVLIQNFKILWVFNTLFFITLILGFLLYNLLLTLLFETFTLIFTNETFTFYLYLTFTFTFTNV